MEQAWGPQVRNQELSGHPRNARPRLAQPQGHPVAEARRPQLAPLSLSAPTGEQQRDHLLPEGGFSVHPSGLPHRQGPLRGSSLLGGRGQPASRGRVLPGGHGCGHTAQSYGGHQALLSRAPGLLSHLGVRSHLVPRDLLRRQRVFPRECSVLGRGGHPSGAQGLPPGPCLAGLGQMSSPCHAQRGQWGSETEATCRGHRARLEDGRARTFLATWKPPTSRERPSAPTQQLTYSGCGWSVGGFNRTMMVSQEMWALSVNITTKEISHA